jgi:hypothetical protein
MLAGIPGGWAVSDHADSHGNAQWHRPSLLPGDSGAYLAGGRD